jgi:hypothetical protein
VARAVAPEDPAVSASGGVDPDPVGDAGAGVQPNRSRNNWLVALCLLALIAVVVGLTGRDPRRLVGAKSS